MVYHHKNKSLSGYTNNVGNYKEKYYDIPRSMSKACQIDCHWACRGRSNRMQKCVCWCHK